MIGLGSNRLTVCRRGGMSVTQAGRGGMEWLAGGRMPLWAQWWLPYSRQAGEALKDAFTAAQWPTIRYYGFAHPEIVGYMNAYAPEDAKIAYSLVEGIGTRWLVGDKIAYVNTGVTGFDQSQDTIEAKICSQDYPDTSIGWILGTRNNGDGVLYMGASQPSASQGGKYFCALGTNYVSAYDCRTPVLWKFSKKNIYYNGVVSEQTNYGYTINRPIFLFRAVTTAGELDTRSALSMIASCKVLDNDVAIRDMIPFKKNGAMGMIDLLTGTFYGNANSSGSFTESIDSPS